MSRARILADYVSSGVTAAEFDFLDTTSGTPGSGTFLRGDKTWVAAGSTSASDLDSGTLAIARMAAGTVIQTTNTVYSSGNSATSVGASLTRVITGSDYHWSGEIENVAASSWVKIEMDFHIYIYRGDALDFGATFGIARNGATEIYQGSHPYAGFYFSTDSQGHTGSEVRDWNSLLHMSLHFVDKSAATGTNTYYLTYGTHTGTTLTIVSAATTYAPFSCTLQEIAQ